MGFIEVITKLFGNKSQKDMRAVMPYVEKIKAVYAEIDALSNDELRARSAALMQRLQDAVAADKSKIVELKASIESLEIDKREKVYNEIDRLEKEVLDIYDKTLNDILPDAFAVVKSTARRFAENETIVVTATQMDRDLAADTRFDFVEIESRRLWHIHTNVIIFIENIIISYGEMILSCSSISVFIILNLIPLNTIHIIIRC
jgi:preprotein translocase subunit SecA